VRETEGGTEFHEMANRVRHIILLCLGEGVPPISEFMAHPQYAIYRIFPASRALCCGLRIWSDWHKVAYPEEAVPRGGAPCGHEALFNLN
jgi:hypothetical protein